MKKKIETEMMKNKDAPKRGVALLQTTNFNKRVKKESFD